MVDKPTDAEILLTAAKAIRGYAYVSNIAISLLTVVFIISKTAGVIDWSWWLVLSPLWVSAGMIITTIAIICIVIWWREGKQ